MKRQRIAVPEPSQGYNRLENLNHQLQERRQRTQGRHDGHSFAVGVKVRNMKMDFNMYGTWRTK